MEKKKPEIIPDLSKVNITHKDLTRINFSDVDLTEEKIIRSNLIESNLNRGNFTSSTIIDSNLSGCDINATNFSKTTLAGIDFSASRLINVNFTKSTQILVNYSFSLLDKVDFNRATISFLNFSATDLSKVINLDKCDVAGSCSIDILTLKNSKNIPLSFLRNIGFPDKFSQILLSLITDQFYSCFISYSQSNEEFAYKLYKDLLDNGIRCWIWQEEIKIGDRIYYGIDEALRKYDKLIVILGVGYHNSLDKLIEELVQEGLIFESESDIFKIISD